MAGSIDVTRRSRKILQQSVGADARRALAKHADKLLFLQSRTGYRLEAVTLRKLEFENDAFALGDKVIEKWYPTKEQGDKKGILLVVTTGKDGAVTGGGGFLRVRSMGGGSQSLSVL